ncbi:EAL domain-containing protein [Massilia sp. BSC265]|uniref:EAL domain-containing protein n=1 Tax=Massilia sp. BSC265 TaxID=1549812 RepID=UPI00068E7AAE|nr:EAL domain-containing protein [Massilia sp. BSC265]
MHNDIEVLAKLWKRQPGPAAGEQPARRRWSRAELVSAIASRQFVPFFQPKVDLKTARLTGVEVLTRWRHPEQGMLLPSEFLEQLEGQGLIEQLTDCVMAQALSCVSGCKVHGRDISLALNISPTTLQAAHAAEHLAELVAASGMCAAQLTIELTETVACETSAAVHESLIRLRELGFQISIDDFGTGYSSMKLLSTMPFTELKIDRSLVSGAVHDPKAALVLESIIQLAGKLRLRTVAEGIETREDIVLLRALGCEVGQGYFLGLPMSHLHFLRSLEAGRTPIATGQAAD